MEDVRHPIELTTVVPVMNRHTLDQAEVSLHDRWPLVRGTGGRRGRRVIHLARLPTTITTSEMHTEYMRCHNYVIVSKPKINATYNS